MITAARNAAFLVIGISLVIIAAVALWLGRKLCDPIFTALETIRMGGESVAATATQISAASNTLADGATAQAASLEETAASVEEMASMTKGNAAHTQRAKAVATEARQSAEGGAKRMAAMQSAMHEILTASQDITKILKTIDEIAFQTNILALNAAVEAARAGEAGMGFAVVAEEVRSLAQRCAAAAKETAVKIEDSVSKSQQGSLLSSEVAQSLVSIQTQIQTLEGLVNEIANASLEQSEGTDQVNIAIAQVDKVTQNNAAVAEECASSVAELSSEAVSLTSTVGTLLGVIGGRRKHDPAGLAGEPRPGGKRAMDRQTNPTTRSAAKPPANPQSSRSAQKSAAAPAKAKAPSSQVSDVSVNNFFK